MKKTAALMSLFLTLLFFGCGRGSYSPSERELLSECKIDRNETNLDDDAVERIESLACDVKSWKNEDTHIHNDEYTHQYPWRDVALSILENPDDVKFLQDHCPICGKQSQVEIFFQSPSKTWENMCGRAGRLTICTTCKKQLDFHCTMMN